MKDLKINCTKFEMSFTEISALHGRQYPGLILSRTSGLEAAVGKFLSNFKTKKFNCSTLTARNFFVGNFIKIMKTYVNRNTLKLSLLQK